MRFKNYRNSYTNDNRIYSKQEMLEMPIREFKERADEFVAQHEVLGLPDEEELRSSSNVIWIDEYTRDDGTKVSGYWRSKPGEGGNAVDTNKQEMEEDNEEKVDDFNSENTDWDDNSEGAEQYYESQKYEESEEYKKEYREREKQKSIERKDPDEIAGVKRGEPKTFEEMVQGGVNPSFEYENVNSGNCQCCVGAAEMRRRGYDVLAVNRNESPIADELAYDDFGLWLDSKTGNRCEPYEIDANKENCYEYLDKTVKDYERYAFSYYAPEDNIISSATENGKLSGHVVTIDRCENGELRYYDPQTGEIHIGEDAKAYINRWTAPPDKLSANSQVLRIDDKKINPYYRNGIFVQKK